MSKIDNYVNTLLSAHIKQISADEGLNQKFMKGFMDVEFDPFVVSCGGDKNVRFHLCGNAYLELNYDDLTEIQDWIEKIDDEYESWTLSLDENGEERK